MDEDSLLRKVLGGELHYAKLWLVCVALRGVSWDNMPFEQRELAFQAKNAAFNCLTIFLTSSAYRYDGCPPRARLPSDGVFVALPFVTLFMIALSPPPSLVCSC
jgi:hypothetical protein